MGRLAHVLNVKIHKEPGKDKVKQAEFPGITRMGLNGTLEGAGHCLVSASVERGITVEWLSEIVEE